jgi:hypothetical protein
VAMQQHRRHGQDRHHLLQQWIIAINQPLALGSDFLTHHPYFLL